MIIRLHPPECQWVRAPQLTTAAAVDHIQRGDAAESPDQLAQIVVNPAHPLLSKQLVSFYRGFRTPERQPISAQEEVMNTAIAKLTASSVVKPVFRVWTWPVSSSCNMG